MGGDIADLAQHLPAAGAFLAGGLGDPRCVGIVAEPGIRDDRQLLPEFDIAFGDRAGQIEPGLQRGTDLSLLAGQFQPAGQLGAFAAQLFPFRGKSFIAPAFGHLREQLQMHGAVLAEAGAPGFLGREAQRWGQPDRQAAVQVVQHGAGGAPAKAIRPIAVHRVLAHVEIEGGQVGGAEIMQLRIDPGPIVAFRRRADLRVQFGQPVQHPALQFGHLLQRKPLGLGKSVQAAEHPAQRVAQAAVQLRLLLQDFRSDAQILGRVG